jgi:DNA-binding transcriptional ArsR family regulator
MSSDDIFAVVAEPTRRRILDCLRHGEHSVNDLTMILDTSQPLMSKHLRILRDAGLASCRVAGRERLYRLEPGSLKELDEWLAPYRRLWTKHLSGLHRHLAKERP